MKKIKLVIMVGLIMSIVSFSFATLSQQEKNIVDTIVPLLEQKMSSYNNTDKIQKYNTLIILLSVIQKNNTKNKELIAYLIDVLKQKMNNIEVQSSQESEQSKAMKNIKRDLVYQSRLERHNIEREALGLKPYIKEQKLNNSAHQRATFITQRVFGGSMHKRYSRSDGYNYTHINNRFKEQGMEFQGQGTLFSENIGYSSYSCNKNDCTQDMINAVKKSFNFFMSEKSYNGAHYRAIIKSHFRTIGLGVASRGGKTYLVSHYGTYLK